MFTPDYYLTEYPIGSLYSVILRIHIWNLTSSAQRSLPRLLQPSITKSNCFKLMARQIGRVLALVQRGTSTLISSENIR